AAPSARDFIIPVYLFRPAHLHWPLAGVLVLAALVALSTLGQGSFGLDNVYERRLAGREVLGGNVVAAYLIPMSLNGAAPLLAFMAGWRRSPLLLVVAVAFAVLIFWLLGLKGSFIYIAAMFGIGVAVGVPYLRRAMIPIGMACLVLVLAVTAIQVSDGSYS